MKAAPPAPPAPPAALRVPAQWQWHYQKLQAIREDLLNDRAEQLEQFEEPLEAPGTDAADSATDEFDHDLALGLLGPEEDALVEVDAAIQRILSGGYGICEMTGKPIPAVRLRATPWTRYTREARSFLEQRNLIERPHLEPVASIQGPAPGGLAEAPDPEAEEAISIENRRRSSEENLRELLGETDLTITSALTQEP